MPLFVLFPRSDAGTARVAPDCSGIDVTSTLNLFRQCQEGGDELQR